MLHRLQGSHSRSHSHSHLDNLHLQWHQLQDTAVYVTSTAAIHQASIVPCCWAKWPQLQQQHQQQQKTGAHQPTGFPVRKASSSA
jgi:hypothetical protein